MWVGVLRLCACFGGSVRSLRTPDARQPLWQSVSVSKEKQRKRSMPSGTIMIGRYGFRGAKKELPDNTIKIVDCRKMGTDLGVIALLKKEGRLKLAHIASGLRDLYRKKFDESVKQAVEEVKAGRAVCCACTMGKNRSQAVALWARSELAAMGYAMDVVYLGNLRPTP